jgi:hypothetical protein
MQRLSMRALLIFLCRVLAVLFILLIMLPGWLLAQEGGCKDIRINAKGTSGAPITVSTVAVPIAEANTARCRLYLINESANSVRCAETTGKYPLTPTTTVGFFLAGNTTLMLPSFAAQQAWSCIRVTADGIINVLEELPGG